MATFLLKTFLRFVTEFLTFPTNLLGKCSLQPVTYNLNNLCKKVMVDLQASITHHYHERTKYDPNTIAAKNKSLKWEEQPLPFKEYKLGKHFDLKPYLSASVPSNPDWLRLSRLMLCSYGVTAKLETGFGWPIYLRSAPSAGGLYPAEVYLIVRSSSSFLPAGLYNYQAKNHSLVQFWDSEVWSDLQGACFEHPALEYTQLALVITAVFYRSAWRYEDRAYRRICLDTGHLLGNIELASAMNGYRPHLIGGFRDEAMNNLLYLDAQQEGVMTIIPLADITNTEANITSPVTALPSSVQTQYPVVPDGELLELFHQATQIQASEPPNSPSSIDGGDSLEDKYNFPFCLKVATSSQPLDWGEDLLAMEKTILQRRSTRAYTGGELNLEELKALLHFSYQPQDYVAQGLDGAPDYFALDLLATFVVVSGVKGLEEGCYYYAPQAQELRQVRFKNFRRELYFLCLGQELGRDAAAVVFHTADLQRAIAYYGERVYRYLHMDAGHLGQRLNLAAMRLGLGVSGIGGFFDDQVNEVLGIPEDEAVIYVTTLGRPRRG